MAKLGDMPQSVKQQLVGVASTFGELSLYLNASSFNNALLLKNGNLCLQYWEDSQKSIGGRGKNITMVWREPTNPSIQTGGGVK